MFKCKQVLLNGKGERERETETETKETKRQIKDAWKMIDHET
jgi:hypothetical protein